jgi:ubiquinone biosynthesis protein COQ4
MATQSALDTRFRPILAFRAVRRLLANPDATQEVFLILKALRGRSVIRLFSRFRATGNGQRILAEKRDLRRALSDDAALAALSPDSLGGRYNQFMKAENLSADGLVAASGTWEAETVSDDVRCFRERMRDMHDLTHVLTGYGRDPLGELCLLAFTYPHSGNPGIALIVLMGFLKIKSWRVRRAVIEAWRNGRKARCWFPAMDWEALMPESVEALRCRFRITPPQTYLQVMA